MAELKLITVDFTVPTSSGDFDITTTDLGGLTPKAAWFMNSRATTLGTSGDDYLDEHGFTDGSNEYCITSIEETGSDYNDTNSTIWNDRVLAETYTHGAEWSASFVQWLTNGVRINFDNAPSSAWKGTVVFLAGADVDVKVGHTLVPNSGSNSASVGFDADAVLFMSNGATSFGVQSDNTYFSIGWSVNDGTTNGNMVCNSYAIAGGTSFSILQQTLGTNYCVAQMSEVFSPVETIWEGRTTNWTSTGFDLESVNGSPDDAIVPWLAIKWGSFSVESINHDITTTDSGVTSLSGYSFIIFINYQFT